MTEKMVLVPEGTYFPSFHGPRGSIELLPLGTVERECAERGERVYQLGDLDELLEELRAAKKRDHRPVVPLYDNLYDTEDVGSLVIERALVPNVQDDPGSSQNRDGVPF